MSDALVENAADEQQVAAGKRTEKRTRDRELADLKALLALPEGRRVFWRLLTHCSAFASIYDDNPQRLAHNAGRQDVGHFLMLEIDAAVPAALFAMMQEHSKEKTT